MRVAPQCEEDLLDHVLGEPLISADPESLGVRQPAVPVIELPESLGRTLSDLLHQLLVRRVEGPGGERPASHTSTGVAGRSGDVGDIGHQRNPHLVVIALKLCSVQPSSAERPATR
jgi:hypothetical protein